MKRQILALLAALALCAVTPAMAETAQGVAYGVYSQAGESPDSLIRVTLTCEDGQITDAQIDEKLIPVSNGGAEGWAELTEDMQAALGEAVLSEGGKAYPQRFALDGVVFTGTQDEQGGVVYTGQVNGEDVALMDYICTDEGGAWYFACEKAELLDEAGETAAEVEIGTKASIEHGVAFWPSELKFPGNIERICAYLVEHGAAYEAADIAQGEDGTWAVADVTTGATLAGTPNYLLIAKEAYQKAIAE
ncbi:MAG: hypothetical protein Q4G52_03410 [Clostridia bacterium]|nr:hypothetical protein [Clostridia bacterium]